MAHEEGAVGGYGVRFSDPEWSDDDETDPKTHVQQRGRGRNRNGMYTTLRFYRDDDNRDDEDNESNIYEMLTTTTTTVM